MLFLIERINFIIILIAALIVTVFDILAGKSLFHLTVCLVCTIIIFSVIGFFVKKTLEKWFEKEDEILEENTEEILDEPSEI